MDYLIAQDKAEETTETLVPKKTTTQKSGAKVS
jgi:hypothetical protein